MNNQKQHKGLHGLILNHLKKHRTISSMEAFTLYGATRLSAIIYTLRNDGYVIINNHKSCINRWGKPVSYVEYELMAG